MAVAVGWRDQFRRRRKLSHDTPPNRAMPRVRHTERVSVVSTMTAGTTTTTATIDRAVGSVVSL